MSVQMEVWGDYACWSRPSSKPNVYSYDVPTPSGARGMLESVYWHPGLRWHIDKIYVMNPIRFTNLRRNEVKSKILASAILSEANSKRLRISTATRISSSGRRRCSAMCINVIEAHFEMTDKASASDNPGKFQDNHQAQTAPGPGIRSAVFRHARMHGAFGLWEGGKIENHFGNAGLWVLCCMTSIFQIRTICSRCFSAPNLKTACLT